MAGEHSSLTVHALTTSGYQPELRADHEPRSDIDCGEQAEEIELTQVLQGSTQASVRVHEALKSADHERQREARKEWLAAQQRRREAWLAMATPLPAGDSHKNR